MKKDRYATEKIREIENLNKLNFLLLDKVKIKLAKKNKLKMQIEFMLNNKSTKYTELEYIKLKKNSTLIEGEIALINKKKKSIEVSIKRNNNSINSISQTCDSEIDISYRSKNIECYKKIYVIDTNIFIDEPKILDYINDDELIIISKTVVDELDCNKQRKKIAYSVREAIRNILSYKFGNMIFVQADESILPCDYKKRGDNLILSVAMQFKKYNPIIITNDIAFSLKAKGEGIETIKLIDIRKLV